MPEYTYLGKIPVPTRDELDDMAAILMAMAQAIDPSLLLRAKNAADLGKYDDVPVGTMVVGTEQDAIWRKKLNGTWAKIWSDTGIITTGIAPTDGSQFHVVHEWGRIRGGRVDFELAARWDGTQLVAPQAAYDGTNPVPGDINDRAVCTVASMWRPETLWPDGSWYSNSAAGQGYIDGSGVITIRNMYPGAVLKTGDQLRIAFHFPEAGN